MSDIEWNGEGLPKPMTSVEVLMIDGTWAPGIYIGNAYGHMVVGCDDTEVVGFLESGQMRPISKERIETARREAAIVRALQESKADEPGASPKLAVRVLAEAGFRQAPGYDALYQLAAWITEGAGDRFEGHQDLLNMAFSALDAAQVGA